MRSYRNYISTISIILLTLLLTGCGPQIETYYTYQAPQGMQGKRCVIQCSQAKSSCQQACNSSYYQCQSLDMQQARFQYREYVSQQRISGQPVTMSLGDFDNQGQCSDSCGCAAKFNDCYTMCGGAVYVHHKCVAFCGKKR